jgi:hypothetical protein
MSGSHQTFQLQMVPGVQVGCPMGCPSDVTVGVPVVVSVVVVVVAVPAVMLSKRIPIAISSFTSRLL